MKNECSFLLSDELRKKIGQTRYPELLQKATQEGNGKLFLSLMNEEKDYKDIAASLGAEREYQEYDRLFDSYLFSGAPSSVSPLVEQFDIFLLAKICFPEEFSVPGTLSDNLDIKKPTSES